MIYIECCSVYCSTLFSRQVVSDSLSPHGLLHARLLCPSPSLGVFPSSCLLNQWCHPSISSSVTPFSSAFNLSEHRVFSNESALHIRWPKYWSFSFSVSTSNEYLGSVSFRIDWFDILAVQGTLKSLLQHNSVKHQFFSALPSFQSNSHNHTWLLERPQP